MKLAQYVEQERLLRRNIHLSRGVWWVRSAFQCCQPLFPLQEIEPGASAPSPWRAAFRYTHVTPGFARATGRRSRILLAGEKLSGFDIRSLDRKRRQAVNRAVRGGLTAGRLPTLEDHWNDLLQIYSSTASRTRYGLPAEYYSERTEEWKARLRAEFALPGRDWFSILHGSKLVAFLYGCIVEETAILLVTKSNEDYLRTDANDLLWNEVIEHYKAQEGCSRIDAGWAIADPPSIDWRKTSWGFERTPIPIYQKTNPAIRLAVRGVARMAGALLSRSEGESRRGLAYKIGVLRARIDGDGSEHSE